MRRFSVLLVGFFSLATLIAMANLATAFPSYVFQIPNGSVVWCVNCHINPLGGGPRNEFGQDFLFNGYLWDPTLASLDSDLDNYNNGEELQDLDGTWQYGDPDPGEPCRVSLPGDDLDTPPLVADLTLDYSGAPVAPGTDLDFTADLTLGACRYSPISFDAWIDAYLPNGQPYSGNPVYGPLSLTLPAGFSVSDYPLSLFVPPPAPPGIYTLVGNTGVYESEVWDSSSFQVEVFP